MSLHIIITGQIIRKVLISKVRKRKVYKRKIFSSQFYIFIFSHLFRPPPSSISLSFFFFFFTASIHLQSSCSSVFVVFFPLVAYNDLLENIGIILFYIYILYNCMSAIITKSYYLKRLFEFLLCKILENPCDFFIDISGVLFITIYFLQQKCVYKMLTTMQISKMLSSGSFSRKTNFTSQCFLCLNFCNEKTSTVFE